MMCTAFTKDGKRCRNNAIPGLKSCYLASHGGQAASAWARLTNRIQNHWLITLISVIGSIGSILGLVWYIRDQQIAARAGRIQAAPEATRMYISVGTTRFRVDEPNGIFLRDGADPVLILKRQERHLVISTRIRDASGNLIAELQNNEWAVNPNFKFDRNYTDDAIEVRDNQGRVALQVVTFGDTIHVSGIFRCRSGKSMVLAREGAEGAVMVPRPPGVEPEYAIQPICKYPSELNFGICPGINELARIVRHGPGPAYRLAGSLDICT